MLYPCRFDDMIPERKQKPSSKAAAPLMSVQTEGQEYQLLMLAHKTPLASW